MGEDFGLMLNIYEQVADFVLIKQSLELLVREENLV
jgi:hypothetical protein